MTSSITPPRRSGLRLTLILSAAAVVAVACGGSSKSGTTTSASATSAASTTPAASTTSAAPAPSPAPSGIRGRLLTSNELPSFQSVGVAVSSSLSSWLAAEQRVTPHQVAAEKAMLIHNGFRGGAREDLTNGGTPGLSIVEQFRSPRAAQAALAFYVALVKNGAGGGFKAFTVHGIPGAQGLTDVNNSGVNIAFSDGPYYYLVGQEGGGAATIAALNSAAVHLYHRVHQ